VVDTSSGNIVEEIDYDEFGNVTNDTAPGTVPFGFAGGLYDKDTGLVRFGARDYDATAGRWTSKDPIRFHGGQINLYAYAANDPVDLRDPTGKISRRDICFYAALTACAGTSVVCAGVFGGWALPVSPVVAAACVAGGVVCVALLDQYVCKKLPDDNNENACNSSTPTGDTPAGRGCPRSC
jgi:RHS repeat-associated protein